MNPQQIGSGSKTTLSQRQVVHLGSMIRFVSNDAGIPVICSDIDHLRQGVARIFSIPGRLSCRADEYGYDALACLSVGFGVLKFFAR
jgi:hypothetical protein